MPGQRAYKRHVHAELHKTMAMALKKSPQSMATDTLRGILSMIGLPSDGSGASTITKVVHLDKSEEDGVQLILKGFCVSLWI